MTWWPFWPIVHAMRLPACLLLAVTFIAVPLTSDAVAAMTTYSFTLQWPSQSGQTKTYHFDVRSSKPRSVSGRLDGLPVERGFVVDNIVACEHRGPAFLDWDWQAEGGYMLVKVVMTTGTCNPGPPVAGRRTILHLTVHTR